MAEKSERKFEPGALAPAFALPDQDGKTVKLSDFKGQWLVLYFYPKDDTPGCTTEACEFTEGIQNFTKMDAAVVGCSPDSPDRHQKFIAKYKLKVRLLSDPDHGMMTAYRAWGQKILYGKATIGVIRSTVIIDPKGKIAHHWATVKAAGHAASVRDKLKELRAAG
jgi:peroxiredoxin Q/BCP